MPPRAEKLPPLVIEDIEPRLAILLVVMLPTGSGVEFMERSAAAAAAEERLVMDCDFLRKA